MRPEASRLFIAVTLAGIGVACSSASLLAAPRGGPGYARTVAPTFRVRPLPPLSFSPTIAIPARKPGPGRFPHGFARGGAGHHGGAFHRARFRYGGWYGGGFGYSGAFYGLPYAYADGYNYVTGGAPPVLGPPQWPVAVGIPPSPVQPPAIYVIGGNRQNAAVSRRGRSPASADRARISESASGQMASGPAFIRVPPGR